MGFPVAFLLLMAVPAGTAAPAATAPAAAAPCPDPSSTELPKLVLPSVKAQSVEIKSWKKDFCVALVEGAESEEKGIFAVALFATGDGSLATRLKATTGPISHDADESVSGLDLAKYDVTTTQTAIGVRLRRHRSYAGGGEATLVTLVLYLPRGKTLDAILATFMSYEAELAGEWAEDGTRGRVGDSDTATLAVSKKRTQGHFDLIRKTSTGTQRLRWDGDGYVAANADPFAKVQLEIFAGGRYPTQ